jgi:S-phase kinase-associated protein 1
MLCRSCSRGELNLVCMFTDKESSEVPIPSVKGEVLDKIVEYMKKHEGTEAEIVEKPLRSKTMAEVVKFPWDAEFIDGIQGRQELYDLILGANYMDIKGLLHLSCAKVASLIKGEPLEKIKEILDPTAK